MGNILSNHTINHCITYCTLGIFTVTSVGALQQIPNEIGLELSLNDINTELEESKTKQEASFTYKHQQFPPGF